MKVAKILNRIAQYKQADIFWAGHGGPNWHIGPDFSQLWERMFNNLGNFISWGGRRCCTCFRICDLAIRLGK